ncbi:MAG: DnaJ domain-containing protein [Patescibacteria group bacterium]
MPKFHELNWEKGFDPESEEYAPTKADIASDLIIKEELSRSFADIERELNHPTEDRVTGEKSKFHVTDPNDLFDSLAYLQVDYLDKVKDPELLKKLKVAFTKLEKKVYKQFIPFIDTRINLIGLNNSPFEKYKYRLGISVKEIEGYFTQARLILEHFKISGEVKIDFLNEINRLQEKFERYLKEPGLFSFERVEEELQKELSDIAWSEYFSRPDNNLKAFDNERARDEDLLKLNSFLLKAQLMQEISKGMLDKEIKESCEARAKSLFEYVEYLKAKSEAPRELLGMEAELMDLLNQTENGGRADFERLEVIGVRLKEMKKKRLGADQAAIIDRISKLFSKTQRVASGEVIDEDEERFEFETTGVDWAWSLLGVERNASKDEVRRAYHKLVLKYHPDRSKMKDAENKMKRINEAFGLIRRVKGF